jgi:hypothetical protein
LYIHCSPGVRHEGSAPKRSIHSPGVMATRGSGGHSKDGRPMLMGLSLVRGTDQPDEPRAMASHEVPLESRARKHTLPRRAPAVVIFIETRSTP